jgi:hypothetical protein
MRNAKVGLTAVLLTAALAGLGTNVAAAGQGRAHVRVGQGFPLGISAPVRSLGPAQANAKATARRSTAATVGGMNVDGVTASTPYDSSVSLAASTAVGPNAIVEVVGDNMRICTKTGSCGASVSVISRLFGAWEAPYCNGTGSWSPPSLSGATAAYDSLADRFVIVLAQTNDAVSTGPGLCVAVSTTGDPNGTYTLFFFPTTQSAQPTFFSARPALGVWPDGYYVSDIAGESVVVLQRSWFVTPQNCCPASQEFAALGDVDFVPTNLTGATAPPTGAANLFFHFFGHVVDEDTQAFDGVKVSKFHVDWANPANTTFGSATTLTFPQSVDALCYTFPEGGCITQPGTTHGDGTNLSGDHGYLTAVNYRNNGGTQSIVFAHNVDLNPPHAGFEPVHAGVSWHEVRVNSSGTPSLFQGGFFAPDSNHYFAGGPAMDKNGDIGLAYSVSSTSVFPSIRATGRLAADGLNTLGQGQTTFVTSSTINHETATVQADWSPNALAIDPNGCTFWNSGLYILNAAWASRITSFTLPGCNLAKGRPATASSVQSGSFPASAAVDGSTSTRWSSASSDPQWLRVDLGSVTNVKKVVLRWEAAYAKAFQIQMSTDGTNWGSPIYSTTTGTGGTQTLTVNGTGRYIRMYGTVRGTQYGYSLYELEAYGS